MLQKSAAASQPTVPLQLFHDGTGLLFRFETDVPLMNDAPAIFSPAQAFTQHPPKSISFPCNHGSEAACRRMAMKATALDQKNGTEIAMQLFRKHSTRLHDGELWGFFTGV